MNTKKKLACLLLSFSLGAGTVRSQTVTLLDLEIAREFGLFDPVLEGAGGDPRLAVLEALIGQKAVTGMAREALPSGQDDLDLALGSLREKLSPAAFAGKLRKFGLREADLRPYLEERLRYDRIVAARFPATLPVSRGDVEKYYRDVYVPGQKAKGLAPDSLETALPAIETAVRDKARARKVAEWVRTIREQAEVRINKDCLK
jgi:hypothetical protein